MKPPLQTLAILRAPLPRRAAIRLVVRAGSVCVLKDFAHEGTLGRRTWAAWLARREAAAYRRLEGIPGVPRLLGRPSPDGLLLECVGGDNCRSRSPEDFSPAFFDRLEEILDRVRSRGVLHGDVKRNVLWSRGSPVLLDFGASFRVPIRLPFRSTLLRLAARYDARAVSKLKALVSPHLLTDGDRRRLREPLPLQSVLRRAQTVLQRVYRREAGGTASA